MVNSSGLFVASFNTLSRAHKRTQVKVFLFAYNRIYTYLFKHRFIAKKPSGPDCIKLIFLSCFLFSFLTQECNKDYKKIVNR